MMKEFSRRIAKLSQKQLAILAMDLQTKLDVVQRAKTEPIAVIGMGCRLPGGAHSPEQYWKRLRDGFDAVAEVPPDRWDADAYFDPDPDQAGKIITRSGGFLDQVDSFDAHFFGISPREAASMDPQHRVFLEVAWEALEHAGVAADKITNSQTGVFVGISATDYEKILQASGPANWDIYRMTGIGLNFAAGHLSFLLGLQGPSMAVDTACSSSLVTVHLACQSLRAGESDLALAGGVNLILLPDNSITTSRSQMLSPDGRCKTFSAAADGIGRAEGCGVVVLKRYSDAVANGDQILALIRGSAVNQDGPSSGLTVPNGLAQQALLRTALSNAGITADQVGYVEAHGTGTILGDPIEMHALGAVYCEGRPDTDPLVVGSVKSNIGHAESAAGVAGLIKTILALQHKEIPPHLHWHEPSPKITWDRFSVMIPTELKPWTVDGGPRFAGVSAFGGSGTNAHVILEEAPSRERETVSKERPYHLFTLSAKNEEALKQLVELYQQHFEANQWTPIEDVCLTANSGRSHFSHRLAIVAEDNLQLRRKLATAVAEESAPGIFKGQILGKDNPKIAFLFTGQGSQYVSMGRKLYESEPVFRRVVDRCDELLQPSLDRSLLSLLYPGIHTPDAGDNGEIPSLDDTAYAQPALFVLEYALAKLWKSWGIEPSALIGHSVGEYVAACLAGVFSLEDGLKLIAERGRLMQALPRNGGMASILADETVVRDAIAPYKEHLSIAAINGPTSIVVSGESQALQELLAQFDADGIKSRRLNVSHAFHSPLIEPMLDDFSSTAGQVSFNAPQIPLISNVTGEMLGPDEIPDAAYWQRHVREGVRFEAGITTLWQQGYRTFIEIGPKPTLSSLGRNCVPEEGGQWLPSLRPNRDDQQQMVETVAELYVSGVDIDWLALDQDSSRHRVSLPTYPFQRQRHWIELGKRPSYVLQTEHKATKHPLLGRQLHTASSQETIFENQVNAVMFPYLEDHRVYGRLILPSPAYMEMGLAAAEEQFGPGAYYLEHMTIHQPVVIPDDETQTVQLIFRPEVDGRASFQIFSQSEDDQLSWHKNVTGEILSGSHSVASAAVRSQGALAVAIERCKEVVDIDAFYEDMNDLGLQFGPRFQGSEQVWRADGEALGLMQLPASLEGTDDANYHVHPAHLDACLHLLGAALPGAGNEMTEAYLLLGLDRLRFYHRPNQRFWCHVQLRTDEDAQKLMKQETFTGDIRLYDENEQLLAELEGLHLKRARAETLFRVSQDPVSDLMYEISWLPNPRHLPVQTAFSFDAMPAPGQIARRVNPLMSEISDRFDLEMYDEMLPELDALCGVYVVQALRNLGWEFQPDQRISASRLVEAYGIIDRHTPLLNRMLGMLAEDGYLKQEGREWSVSDIPARIDPDPQWKALLDKYPLFEGELMLTGRCARELAEALRGDVDPLQLLFPGGSLSEIEKVYKDSPSARGYNSLIEVAVSELLEQFPAGRKLRILEIGAGTGGTTAHLLPLLPADQTEYVFSDISPLFVAKAAESFADYPFVQYQTLDITDDLVTQGFEANQFDLIVAANVIHATPDLRQTLDQVKKLLASNGNLLLLEGTKVTRFGDLTVGLTDGWWSFTDTDLRPSYALMERNKWLDLLAEMGFEESIAIPDADTAIQAVILAKGPHLEPKTDDETVVSPFATQPGKWLIFADAEEVGHNLAELLQSRGQYCVQIEPGNDYDCAGDGRFTVNPAVPEHFQNLLEELQDSNELPIHGIVHLWSLDALPLAGITPEQLHDDQIKICGSVLHLVQAVGQIEVATPPRLTLVTRGAQQVGEATVSGQSLPVQVPQSSLWGLSQVISIEHPELHCESVDLDPSKGSEDELQQLFLEIWQPDPDEDQIAFRQQERRVRRLVHSERRPPGEQAPITFSEDASYLITGGLGGLGLLVAQWMVEHGAKNLVLMGRSGASETAQSVLSDLEQEKARVEVVQGDISNRSELAAILDDIEQTMPPLRGIIHAAGVLDDGVLLQQTWERFTHVMGAKVDGSWNLHALTSHLSLDFFILFSSGVSLIGFAGQGNHAAANAFMDALAHYRQANGLPGVSINWGAWSNVGAAAERNLEEQEIEALSPHEGLQLLARTLEVDAQTGLPVYAQIGALPVNWSQFFAPFPPGNEPPLFAEIAQEIKKQAKEPATKVQIVKTEPDLLRRLEAALPNKRLSILRDYIREQSALVLGLDRSDAIELQRPLSELGLDSLMAVELRNKLGNALNQTLPATLLFEYPTIGSLTEYLMQEFLVLESPTDLDKGLPNIEGEPVVDNLDSLSEDEMEALLLKKLEAIRDI